MRQKQKNKQAPCQWSLAFLVRLGVVLMLLIYLALLWNIHARVFAGESSSSTDDIIMDWLLLRTKNTIFEKQRNDAMMKRTTTTGPPPATAAHTTEDRAAAPGHRTARPLRQFLRFDQAGFPDQPHLQSISHALPHAVPDHRTIPRHLAQSRDYHLAQRRNTSRMAVIKQGEHKGQYDWVGHDYSTDHRPIYLMNPAIVHLNKELHGEEDFLSDESLRALTGGGNTNHVRYVAIFRAALGCNCFGTDDPARLRMMNFQEPLSYLAIALLDDQLDVVEDVLIDINAGPGKGKYFKHTGQDREDCRISLFRQSFYVTCKEQIHRLRIERTDRAADTTIVKVSNYGTRDNHRIPYIYPNIYGTGLTVTLTGYHGKLAKGKNFNMFKARHDSKDMTENDRSSRSSGDNEYYLQVYPIQHQYLQLNIPAPNAVGDFSVHFDDERKRTVQQSMAALPLRPSFDTPDVNNTVLLCPENDFNQNPGHDDSNCTSPREVSFFEPDQDHGSACCISLSLFGHGEHGQPDVMVGISHQKTHKKSFQMLDKYRRYNKAAKQRFVSRFIAYNTTPPFDIVAVSGWFCLGFFGNKDTTSSRENSLAGTNTKFRLDLFNDTFDCPIIHFVSGITDHADDPQNKAVIAYGVNDCYPMMIVVEKSEIRKRLLFGK